MFRYYRRQSLDIKLFFFLYFMVCLFLQNHDHRFLAITNAVKTRFFNKQLIKMRYTDLSKRAVVNREIVGNGRREQNKMYTIQYLFLF